jgi:hypothetical protein
MSKTEKLPLVKFNHPLDKPQCVGVYTPSQNWAKYQHVAVMLHSNKEENVLIASTGYLGDDYEGNKACIEQANLYAHAVELYQAAYTVYELLENPNNPAFDSLREVLSKIADTDEPLKRVLNTPSV